MEHNNQSHSQKPQVDLQDSRRSAATHQSAMPSFFAKPFPPPGLTDVPVEYIIKQLHDMAPQFWDRPDTADCTIVIPIPHAQNPSQSFPLEPTGSTSISFEHSGGGNRRATQPPANAVPRLSLELHMDYLSAHSTYLRSLFSGALPLDLMYAQSPPRSSTSSSIPPDRLPRLMPSSPDHPILFLPVPDPSSIHLLFHWMYFGDVSFIAECLRSGKIQWEGIARNVEYLGLSSEIKLFLGRWYNAWLNPTEVEAEADQDMAYDSDGTAYTDSDDEDRMSSSTESDLDDELEKLKEPSSRGRNDFSVKAISFQSFIAPAVLQSTT
ncbi:hypothetical protein FA15DRAFT_663362 [Coprinopsis marcescibilis]|uniref:BTB domain-containing protein n=1 Tax=Coprinopsis marcescibilis TaxID=230819 RepID=A0A5C3LDP0_COPMA|nr:hypothetical protein FA15DRAFT_663362 [Coprinopsis marcescibilis]